MAQKDPYRYFRIEAKELLEGMSQELSALEQEQQPAPCVTRILRYAHTLKGAARVVKLSEIANVAHSIEEILSVYREATSPIPLQTRLDVLQLLHEFSARLAAIENPTQAPFGEPLPPQTNPSHTTTPPVEPVAAPVWQETSRVVRIELSELEVLNQDILEVRRKVNELQELAKWIQEASALAHEPQRASSPSKSLPHTPLTSMQHPLGRLDFSTTNISQGLNAIVGNLQRKLSSISAELQLMKLAPASLLCDGLEQVAQDAATALHKQVRLHIFGTHYRFESHILWGLRQVLLHLVRNAVAHGIEAPALRTQRGKAPQGQISLRISQQNQVLCVSCQDDGGGIDTEAILQTSKDKGWIAPDTAAISHQDMLELLMRGGLSTKVHIDEISGRGIGFNVAQDIITQLQGHIEVQTAPQVGTTISLHIPISIVSSQVLLVEIQQRLFALPQENIRQVVQLPPSARWENVDKPQATVSHESFPYVCLRELLGGRDASSPASLLAVMLTTAQQPFLLEVERIQGLAMVIVQPLPAYANAAPWIAGAALDETEIPILLLDPSALLELYPSIQTHKKAPEGPLLPILVVDDSLTTRMLEQSILEAAGYQVVLASSAEEALALAQQQSFCLCIVDVEMPGMNGFEFIQATRHHATLQHTPCILVTSLDSPASRKRGLESGACAYITKHEFNQEQLLQRIKQLVGAPSLPKHLLSHGSHRKGDLL